MLSKTRRKAKARAEEKERQRLQLVPVNGYFSAVSCDGSRNIILPRELVQRIYGFLSYGQWLLAQCICNKFRKIFIVEKMPDDMLVKHELALLLGRSGKDWQKHILRIRRNRKNNARRKAKRHAVTPAQTMSTQSPVGSYAIEAHYTMPIRITNPFVVCSPLIRSHFQTVPNPKAARRPTAFKKSSR
jgi:hypothetical protein